MQLSNSHTVLVLKRNEQQNQYVPAAADKRRWRTDTEDCDRHRRGRSRRDDRVDTLAWSFDSRTCCKRWDRDRVLFRRGAEQANVLFQQILLWTTDHGPQTTYQLPSSFCDMHNQKSTATSRCPSCHPNSSVKASKKAQLRNATTTDAQASQHITFTN